MAEGVVVAFEVVHVENRDGQWVAGASGTSQLAVHLLVPPSAICGSGKRVATRLHGQQSDKIGPVDSSTDFGSQQFDKEHLRLRHLLTRLVEADHEHGGPASV